MTNKPSAFPPRVWVRLENYTHKPCYVCDKEDYERAGDAFRPELIEYLSLAKHEHLASEREMRAREESFREAANKIADLFPKPHTDQKIYDEVMALAKSSRAPTTEKGGE